MGRVFEVGGTSRYLHQQRALQKMVKTGGVTALLLDPGLGKTAVIIDYACLLAAKQDREVRVLVICPLVAIDTWVMQMDLWASPQVGYWAEALGGSILQRAEAMAARGGHLYKNHLNGRGAFVWKPNGPHPMALHVERSVAWSGRRLDGKPAVKEDGPGCMGEGARVTLVVTNQDTFSRRDRVGSRGVHDILLDAVKRFAPDMIVLDEAHKIKGATSNTSKMLARLGPVAPRRAILTGTVMPHSPMDIFGQWRFLDPYAFGEMDANGVRKQATMGVFRERFAVMGGWMGKQIIAYKNLDDMQEIMARNAIVVRKREALDLPPFTDVEVPVNLSPAEVKAYTEMKDQLATQLAAGTFASSTNRLTQLLRLRQVTSGHITDDKGRVQVIGRSKVLTAASLVNDTLAQESRVVVFAYFVKEMEMLGEALQTPGTEVMMITGETGGESRMSMRRRFGSSDPGRIVMVAQIRTMSLAVNELVTASHAVFLSLSQQRDDWVQARDRLDRIGQTQPVTFWSLVAPGTVDEVILSAHKRRENLERAMLKHVAGLSS